MDPPAHRSETATTIGNGISAGSVKLNHLSVSVTVYHPSERDQVKETDYVLFQKAPRKCVLDIWDEEEAGTIISLEDDGGQSIIHARISHARTSFRISHARAQVHLANEGSFFLVQDTTKLVMFRIGNSDNVRAVQRRLEWSNIAYSLNSENISKRDKIFELHRLLRGHIHPDRVKAKPALLELLDVVSNLKDSQDNTISHLLVAYDSQSSERSLELVSAPPEPESLQILAELRAKIDLLEFSSRDQFKAHCMELIEAAKKKYPAGSKEIPCLDKLMNTIKMKKRKSAATSSSVAVSLLTATGAPSVAAAPRDLPELPSLPAVGVPAVHLPPAAPKHPTPPPPPAPPRLSTSVPPATPTHSSTPASANADSETPPPSQLPVFRFPIPVTLDNSQAQGPSSEPPQSQGLMATLTAPLVGNPIILASGTLGVPKPSPPTPSSVPPMSSGPSLPKQFLAPSIIGASVLPTQPASALHALPKQFTSAPPKQSTSAPPKQPKPAKPSARKKQRSAEPQSQTLTQPANLGTLTASQMNALPLLKKTSGTDKLLAQKSAPVAPMAPLAPIAPSTSNGAALLSSVVESSILAPVKAVTKQELVREYVLACLEDPQFDVLVMSVEKAIDQIPSLAARFSNEQNKS